MYLACPDNSKQVNFSPAYSRLVAVHCLVVMLTLRHLYYLWVRDEKKSKHHGKSSMLSQTQYGRVWGTTAGITHMKLPRQRIWRIVMDKKQSVSIGVAQFCNIAVSPLAQPSCVTMSHKTWCQMQRMQGLNMMWIRVRHKTQVMNGYDVNGNAHITHTNVFRNNQST